MEAATCLFLGVGKQFSDVLLTRANVLIQDFGTVYNLRFASVEHLADLSSHQRFTGPGRPIEQET